MPKKITDYENTSDATITELPGGDNVRIGYSRGVSLNYGEVKVDYHYSADFPAEEVDTALEKVKTYINSKVKKAVAEKL